MNSRWTGYLFCTLAMIGVGSTVVASKLIAHGLPPFSATALRFAIAFPVFVAAMKLAGERWPRVSAREALLLTVQAGSGSVGYTVLLLAGLRFTSATNAGVITGSLPAVAALIAVLALRERPGRLTVAAVALASIGVFVCTGGTGSTGGTANAAAVAHAASTLLGNLFIVAAVFCEGLFILLNKRLRTPISPLQMSTLMSGIGLALSLVPALIERPWTKAIDVTAIEGVVYYALVPTVGGFLLWFAGAARIAGAQAGAFTAFVPLSAAVLAALVLHETIGVVQLMGMLCVLVAVALIVCDGMREESARLRPCPQRRERPLPSA
ncbi:DMT family transporter [Trinickia fusca]|uniref:DMT family transporter n=1 Tax=Trinickia fusca TaxID=2419777 RepID=A0A494WY01_9BURK|nr:DMT family transporter [Trinickia fusca]RKP43428.1 DMT family transporter [Trinickia fusca]